MSFRGAEWVASDVLWRAQHHITACWFMNLITSLGSDCHVVQNCVLSFATIVSITLSVLRHTSLAALQMLYTVQFIISMATILL